MARTYRNFYEYVYVPREVSIVYTGSFSGSFYYPNPNGPSPLNQITSSDPDWKVNVAKRINATGTYTRRREWHGLGRSTVRSLTISGPSKLESVGTFRTPFSSTAFVVSDSYRTDPSLQDLAVRRLRSAIKDRVSSVNILVPLGELNELRGLLRQIIDSVLGLLKAVMDLKKRGNVADLSKRISELWLQWSFAIAPTIAEAQEIADAISEALLGSSERTFTDFGSAKKDFVLPYKLTHHSAYGGNSFITAEAKCTLSYRAACGYFIPVTSGNSYDSLSSHLGLEIGSIVPTLWELLPFSWLIDYFSTVGAALDDTFVAKQEQPFYVVVTRKFSCETRWTVSPAIGSNIIYSYADNSKAGITEYSEIQRYNYGSTIPQLLYRFKSIDEIGNNALKKLLNLIAILGSGSKPRRG